MDRLEMMELEIERLKEMVEALSERVTKSEDDISAKDYDVDPTPEYRKPPDILPLGGGDGEKTTLRGNWTPGQKISGDLDFSTASDSNVRVATDDANNTITIGVYYL